MNEHEFEPIRGLPELLPAGESIIWRGEPEWRSLARRVFHVRKVAFYFVLLLTYSVGTKLLNGASFATVVDAASWQATLAVVTLGILYYLAWLYARTTVYTLTTERLILRFGVALTMVIHIPWSKITHVDLLKHSDGTGDIAFTVDATKRMSYLLLWPQARPWKFAPVIPSMRCIAEPDSVAAQLAEVLITRSANSNAAGSVETQQPAVHNTPPAAAAS